MNKQCDNPARTNGYPACLLEVLQFRVGCMYLSDLHIPANFPLIRRQLQKIDPVCFSLRDWNDAVAYITGEKACFDSPAQAAAYLETWPSAPAAVQKASSAGGKL